MIGRLARLLRPATPRDDRRCGTCAAFANDAHAIEAAMPGLRSMGSAAASVRSDDGLCATHDRYTRASALCGSFHPR